MRFLILTQYYLPEIGAAQVRLAATARELRSLGHEVEVVTAMPNHPRGTIFPEYQGRFYMREEIDGVVVHRVWLYAALGAGPKRLLNYLSFVVTCLWGLLRCCRPDYVFVESPPLFLSLSGFVAAALWRAKLVFHVADLWPDSARDLKLLRNKLILGLAERLETWSYRVSDKVNAATEGIRTTLVTKKGVPAEKVLFQPNGVDANVFTPLPVDEDLIRQLGLQGKRIVLYAGTHGFAHGIETALLAARLLADRPDIRFLLMGDGSEKAKLVKLADELRLTNVHFLDPQPAEVLARFYSISCIGLSTLRDSPLFEGTRPVKIFSAMACGVPVVYSGAGEGARLVESTMSGVVTPPEDAGALAEAVTRLVDDSGLCQRLGQNGRAYVEKQLTWHSIISKWVTDLDCP